MAINFNALSDLPSAPLSTDDVWIIRSGVPYKTSATGLGSAFVSPRLYDNGVRTDAEMLQAALDGHAAVVIDIDLTIDEQVDIPSGRHIIGAGATLTADAAYRVGDILNGEGQSDIRIENLHIVGNFDTADAAGEDDSATQCAISFGVDNTAGSSNISIIGNHIEKMARHGIRLDKITGGEVKDNVVEDIRFGAGILLTSTTASTGLTVTGNRVARTQYASIQAYYGLSDSLIDGNTLEDSGHWATSTLVGGDEEIADNITGYTTTGQKRVIISNNVCMNGGPHNIHWGSDNVSIIGNVCSTPKLYSNITVGSAPNTNPDNSTSVVVMGNVCEGVGRDEANTWGISIHDIVGFVVQGNEVSGSLYGIILHGFEAGYTVTDGVVLGNIIRSIGDVSGTTGEAIRVRGGVKDVLIALNIFNDTYDPISFELNTTGNNTASVNDVTMFGNQIIASTTSVATHEYGMRIGRGRSGAAAATTGADQLVLEGNTNAGLTIFTPNTGLATLAFGDPDSSNVGTVSYDHSTNLLSLRAGGSTNVRVGGTTLGFYGATAASKPTITGSRGGNAALASLLTQLATLGLITDSSS
ncbi:MAG: right-handed parallel beta-helix repeat-containing protein [Sphingomonadaceae bacterium]